MSFAAEIATLNDAGPQRGRVARVPRGSFEQASLVQGLGMTP